MRARTGPILLALLIATLSGDPPVAADVGEGAPSVRAGRWKIPLDVDPGAAFVRGGIPFPKGALRRDEAVRLTGGQPCDSEVLAVWGDGTVRWLLVEAAPDGRHLTLEPGGGDPGPGVAPPVPEPGSITLVADGAAVDLGEVQWRVERERPLSARVAARGTLAGGLRWSARLERFAGEDLERLRLEVLNPTPTSQRHGQPKCTEIGCEGSIPIEEMTVSARDRSVRVRWAGENGATISAAGAELLPEKLDLRPGERVGWEIVLGEGPVEPALLEYPAPWACNSGALGPLVPVNTSLFREYERNAAVGGQTLRDNRALPHWRNPREHGEDQRDWDGGRRERDFQTHNNEYDVHLAYAKQRLRTMGRGAVSRDWHYLGLTGTRHFANVDIYHVHEGPLTWMHGAQFQHIKHGGKGQTTRHRSTQAPNMAHTTGRGLLAWYYLTGDPLLYDAFTEMSRNAEYRVRQGPGGPGYSNTHGEERAPAGGIWILTEAWVHTGDSDYLEAARKAVRESHASEKPYVTHPEATDWRCKPWMIALLVDSLDRFADAAVEYGEPEAAAEARQSAALYKAFLVRTVATRDGLSQVPYKFSNDPERHDAEPTGSWNVVVADALIDTYPDVAEAVFRSGSSKIWYPRHPSGEYATLLSHTVLAGWGHRTMAAIVARGS